MVIKKFSDNSLKNILQWKWHFHCSTIISLHFEHIYFIVLAIFPNTVRNSFSCLWNACSKINWQMLPSAIQQNDRLAKMLSWCVFILSLHWISWYNMTSGYSSKSTLPWKISILNWFRISKELQWYNEDICKTRLRLSVYYIMFNQCIFTKSVDE